MFTNSKGWETRERVKRRKRNVWSPTKLRILESITWGHDTSIKYSDVWNI